VGSTPIHSRQSFSLILSTSPNMPTESRIHIQIILFQSTFSPWRALLPRRWKEKCHLIW